MNSSSPTLPEPPTTPTPNRNWTQRWAELRPHPEQQRLWESEARFKIVPAGRRSGKTELGKRRLVEHLFRRTWHGQPGRYFAAAPTRDQAKRIFWRDLKALVPRPWTRAISESELCVTTRRGAELWVVGLDKAERIEGTPWDGCVIDELANCKPGIFYANIRPALADRQGWAWLIGVPDFDSPGQVEYAQMYDVARSGADPEWEGFNWPSADILPPEEVESARRRMDPLLFDQEFGGKFIKPGGLAFPTFDYKTHVRDDLAAYDPALPLCWALDFNVNPMCSGVIQHHGGEVRVLHEFSLADSSTDSACTAFLEWLEAKGIDARGRLAYYGDATGHARDSTSGTTDWRIVANRLRNLSPACKVPTAPFRVKDTVNSVRAKLKTAAGRVSLYVNSQCRVLISDFQSALWPSDMSECHSLAWLRYFVQYQYPVLYDARYDGRPAAVPQPA
jgi:hypothetical protein